MNKAILYTEVQDFINENLNTDTGKLIFKKSNFSGVAMREIVQQIEGKRKAKEKLPTWFKTNAIYYPPKINLEQTSSETTARYKSKLVSGKSLADLTGGLGIDSYYFSKEIKEVFHFETNKTLSEIARHNFSQLKVNINCIHQDGIEAIKNKTFDCIYIDPSRRSDVKGKVFLLSDCEPDVVKNLDYFLERCSILLIKTSPMLDISAGLKELHSVCEIHIVAVENEVKELLWLIKKVNSSNILIKTINISKNNLKTFETEFVFEETISFSSPKKYLYEPNAAIMKSGMFQALAERFQVKKLAVNTHLFTSDALVEFPGRKFEIEKILPYKKKGLIEFVQGIKANVTTRNFPETVDSLKKRWKISDGGDTHLFFTTDNENNKLVVFCRKIKD